MSRTSSKPTTPRTLAEFFAALDARGSRIPIGELAEALRGLDVELAELERFAVFDETRYRRNVVHTGPGYQALLLCWRAGQRSPIHDHRGSACAVRVLRGTVTETIFERTPDGFIYPTSTQTLQEGQVCGSEDADIHQISNLAPAGTDLVTLHVYAPPLHVMGVYSMTEPTVREEVDPVFEFAMGSGI